MTLTEHAIHALTKRAKKLLYGKFPGFAGSFPYCGVKVYFPANSLIFQRACEEKIYERDLVRLLSALVRPETAYFDVGANIGLMSIPILQSCASCKVVSFEPSPHTFPYLQRTADQSRFRDRWIVIPKASGDQNGTLEFHVFEPGLGAYDGFKDTKRGGISRRITVPVTTLDSEWNVLGRPSVSVIKIDVEGAELQVLQGGKTCIQDQQSAVLIEWNSKNLVSYNCAPELILEFACGIGYQVFSLPYLCPVTNAKVLRLQMLQTENFLLVPDNYDVERFAFLY